MIEINLLPQELRKKESRFKAIDLSTLNLQNIPVMKIGIAFIAALVLLHLTLFGIGAYGKGRAQTLTKKYNELLPQKKEADALKGRIGIINKKATAIDELMVKRFSWAKKLNALSDSMTPGIWLSEISYDERLTERTAAAAKNSSDKGKKEQPKSSTERVVSRYLIMSGYATSMGEQGTALIGRFIKNLKDNTAFFSDFDDIELLSMKIDRFQDQEVMNFKIICSFREKR